MTKRKTIEKTVEARRLLVDVYVQNSDQIHRVTYEPYARYAFNSSSDDWFSSDFIVWCHGINWVCKNAKIDGYIAVTQNRDVRIPWCNVSKVTHSYETFDFTSKYRLPRWGSDVDIQVRYWD